MTQRPINKICKHCGAEIKGKPIIYDDYYFCPTKTCSSDYQLKEMKGEPQ